VDGGDREGRGRERETERKRRKKADGRTGTVDG
jgi:hypothetical protein